MIMAFFIDQLSKMLRIKEFLLSNQCRCLNFIIVKN